MRLVRASHCLLPAHTLGEAIPVLPQGSGGGSGKGLAGRAQCWTHSVNSVSAELRPSSWHEDEAASGWG